MRAFGKAGTPERQSSTSGGRCTLALPRTSSYLKQSTTTRRIQYARQLPRSQDTQCNWPRCVEAIIGRSQLQLCKARSLHAAKDTRFDHITWPTAAQKCPKSLGIEEWVCLRKSVSALYNHIMCLTSTEVLDKADMNGRKTHRDAA